MDYVQLALSLGIQGFVAGNEYRAKCPLHDDQNPSFSMRIDSGICICFKGCIQGEFTSLVEQILGCGHNEAQQWILSNGRQASVEQLSKRLALELEQQPGQPNYLPQDMGWLARYRLLVDNVMPMWFLERGFSWDTIWTWGIKYDPVWDSVHIPVWWQKELIGTITRNTNPKMPKYQNSTNLPRSEILFGLEQCNVNKDGIILVEGVLDCLWLWQLGYNCAALLGTFISGKQMAILEGHRLGEITLALDNDEAGQKGTEEAIKKLTKAGYLHNQISIVHYPDNKKDAQDCTIEELELAIQNKTGIFSFTL